MKTNKNGVKLLAIIAVFTMAFAGLSVITTDDADATKSYMPAVNDFTDSFENSNADAITLGNKDTTHGWDGSDTITLDKQAKADYYSNGIRCDGALNIIISEGVTLNIDAENFGIIAKGAINISGDGKLIVKVSGEYSEGVLRAVGIIGTGVTISVKELEVYVNADGSLASGAYSVAIESAGATNISSQKATIYGGNRGIYNYSGNITLNPGSGKTITIGAYEKALRTASGKVIVSSGKVITKLLNGEGVNSTGTDDRFGIKTTLVEVATSAVLETQGLRVSDPNDTAIEGSIIVLGGYEQENGAAFNVAGLYVGSKTFGATTVTTVTSVPTTPAASTIYVMDSADVYGIAVSGKNTIVTDTTTTTGDGAAEKIATAITSSTSNVQVKFTGTFSSQSITIPSLGGKNLSVTIPTTGIDHINVTFASTETGTFAINLETSTTYTFTNGGNVMKVSGVSGTIFVEKGSIASTVDITGGVGTIEITDDTLLRGEVDANITIQKSTGAQNYTVDLSNLQISTGKTITISDVVVNSTSPIVIRGTGAIILGDNSSIDGTLYVQDGKVNGKINNGNLYLTGNVTVNQNLTVNTSGKITVSKDCIVTISNGVTLTNNGTINVYGKIQSASNNTGTGALSNNGKIILLDKTSDLPNNTSGTGTIDVSSIASSAELNGDIETITNYGRYQTVTITADTTLISGTKLTFQGILIINDGVKVTIEDGAQLVISGFYATLENNGTIIVESDVASSETARDGTTYFEANGGFVVDKATVNNNGLVSASYVRTAAEIALGGTHTSITIKGSANFNNNGDFATSEYNGVTASLSTFKNASDSTISINGSFTGTVVNAGKVIVNGSLTAVSQSAKGAIVSVISSGAITINDNSLTKYAGKTIVSENGSFVIPSLGTNVASIGGFTITSNVSKDSSDNYVKSLTISGSINTNATSGNTVADQAQQINLTNNFTINDEFTVSKTVKFSGGKIAVSGTLSLEDGNSIYNASSVTVTGTIISGKVPFTAGTINAASYKVTIISPASTTYYYTTLDKAIIGASDAQVTEVSVYGTSTVLSNVTIPSGMTVKQINGTISIGSSTNTDVSLTVAEGGKLDQTTGTINVDGTLYVEDKNGGIKKGINVICQVRAEGEKDLRYTNLNNAIMSAGSDPVVIKLNGRTDVTNDMTIPSNVTVDMNGQVFKVTGAKLTIDGTLSVDNNANYTVVNDVNETTGIVKKGEVILNGYIISDVQMMYNDTTAKTPAGAYYSVGDKYYITSASNAPTVITEATDGTVSIYGKNIVQNLNFIGTSDKKLTVNIKGDLTAGTISLDFTTLTIDSGKAITAKIANTVGSVSLRDAETTAKTTFTASESSSVKTLTITSGGLDTQPGKVKTYSTTIDGDVSIKALSIALIDSGKYYSLTVDGNAKVVKGTNNLGYVLVNGTLTADYEACVSATSIDVVGTLTAEKATDTKVAGSINVTNVITVGSKFADIGSTSTISGSVSYGIIYVLNGSVVEDSIIKTSVDAGKYTEYYVEDALWITAYVGTLTSVPAIKTLTDAPVEDAFFTKKWYSNLTSTGADKSDDPIGSINKVYALIEYDIYDIEVVADNGIGTISIDGIVLVKGAGINGENVFTLPSGKLKAGTHQITYTVKDGYGGTVKILVDGTAISGNNFTLSGTEGISSAGIVSVSINVSGTTPVTPEPTPIEPTPVEPKDDSLGITEYLLIVLVVLAAILVVVVAIRMMRS